MPQISIGFYYVAPGLSRPVARLFVPTDHVGGQHVEVTAYLRAVFVSHFSSLSYLSLSLSLSLVSLVSRPSLSLSAPSTTREAPGSALYLTVIALYRSWRLHRDAVACAADRHGLLPEPRAVERVRRVLRASPRGPAERPPRHAMGVCAPRRGRTARAAARSARGQGRHCRFDRK